MTRKKKAKRKQTARKLTRRESALLQHIRAGTTTITEAARKAGFSTKWPGQAGAQASRNIQRKMPTLLDELGMTYESIIRRIEEAREKEEKEKEREEIEIIDI